MSGMSYQAGEPESRPVADSPTVIMPRLRGRHAGGERSSLRWLIGVIGGGAVLAVMLGVLTGLLLSNGGAQRPQPVVAAPSGVQPVDDPMATATLDASPTPTVSASVTAQPAQLIAAMRSTIRDLVDADRIDGDAAEELDDDLKDAARALADDRIGRVWSKLSDVAGRLRHLHEEGDLPDREYQTLAAVMTQLANTLPRT